MDVIPVETIMNIFKYLDRHELWAVTLVAVRFRAVATNILYHELFLLNSRLSRLLVSVKVNPFNATIIKRVEVFLESTCTPPERWKELFDLLTHTQNLERLYVSPVGYMDGVEWYPPPLPRLQILEFKRLRMSSQLAESLVVLPELKCLKMGRIHRLKAVATNPSPTHEHLKTIMKNMVEFEGSMTLIMYLRDYGKLKYLSTSLYESVKEEWRHLDQVAGATLQSLRVHRINMDDCHQFISRASRFSALRYLGVVPLNITEPPPTMVRHIAFVVGLEYPPTSLQEDSDYQREIEDWKRSNEVTLKMLSSIPSLRHFSTTSTFYGNSFMPLWNPILQQLSKMANHELQQLRSLDLFMFGSRTDHFLYKRVENKPNEFATSCSDSGRWIEMKEDRSISTWRSDWFEN
jgi:hypothetical protein